MQTPQCHDAIAPTVPRRPGTFFDLRRAADLVAQLNEDSEDGWTYLVDDTAGASGRSRIAVYDEEGEFVEYL